MNEPQDPEVVEPESVLSTWEPAGLLLSLFFITLPPVVTILIGPKISLFLLVIWAIWAIYLALSKVPINKLAGTRLLFGCVFAFAYLAFYD